jgi:hypothetical protein
MSLHDGLCDFTNQCDGVHNPSWERAKYLTPNKLNHKTIAIQHMQVNQFAKKYDIYTAHSLDGACQTTPHAFCSKFMHSHVADCDWY